MNNIQQSMIIFDQYDRNRIAQNKGNKYNPEQEAKIIYNSTRILGDKAKRIAIVNQADQAGVFAYQQHCFNTVAMNGDRPEKLSQVIQTLIKNELNNTNHLFLFASDPIFSPLCQEAQQKSIPVNVFSLTPSVSYEFGEFCPQNLDVVISNHSTNRVSVFIDYENIHIGLERKQFTVKPQTIIQAIRAAIRNQGDVTSIKAYADFDLLARGYRLNIQRTLALLGVDSCYRPNIGLKNCADMQIADDIRTVIENDSCPEVIVIVSGDRDFYPVIRTIKNKGIKVVILSLKDCLSQQLVQQVNDVYFLDDYFVKNDYSK